MGPQSGTAAPQGKGLCPGPAAAAPPVASCAMARLAYLHGLGSGPQSYKGTLLRERLAPEHVLELPDLNRPSLERLDPVAGLDHLARLTASGDWCLIGSSYGGWLAALFQARHPERVRRMLLLCPGFGLTERWPSLLGPELMAQWERTGWLPLERGERLHHSFLERCRPLDPAPAVTCPTTIVHGRYDDVVPFESSAAYAKLHEHIELVAVDDDHGLTASVDRIEALVRTELIGDAP